MKLPCLVLVLGVVVLVGPIAPTTANPGNPHDPDFADRFFYGVAAAGVRVDPENGATGREGVRDEGVGNEEGGAYGELGDERMGDRFRRDVSDLLEMDVPEVDGPSEFNWEARNLRKRSVEEDPPPEASSPQHSDEKITGPSQQVPGQRKTIIPLEGIVFAKIKDNHLVRPKLTSRMYAPGSGSTRKLKSKSPLKRARLGTASRRFELYPRWYSRSVPSLFGKEFARHYYKPYQRQQPQAVGGSARHIIGHHRKPHTRSGSVFHELPLSWMTGSSRDGIPKEHREGSYNYDNYYAKNFDETKLEGMEGEGEGDGVVMNPHEASKGRHLHRGATGGPDKKSLPFLKDLPHEIMSELNPYEYTVTPGM